MPASAVTKDTVRVFRIGMIGSDPARTLQDFESFSEYLRTRLAGSSVRSVTLFVARDLEQMKSRLRKGKLDFVLASSFPVAALEPQGVTPALVALGKAGRADPAVFFVRRTSSFRELADLRGRTIVFGTPWSTGSFALAVAELKKNGLTPAQYSLLNAAGDVIRFRFGGEPINQAFQVIRSRADAGVMNASDWQAIPQKERSLLRIVHRTQPVTSLFGAFSPFCPPSVREAVEQSLLDMSGNREGRAALGKTGAITGFERPAAEDRSTLLRLKREFDDKDGE